MIEQTQIQKWAESGIITPEQAERMLADVAQYKKERSSNRFITAISTIGAIFLGVGMILFMASNWEEISDAIKVAILLSSTLGAYYAGYFLRYQRENFPRVGDSLIFLSTLLFGATLFLIAQMYHSSANAHWLVLIWLVCVLPVAYLFESVPIAGLSSLLFFVWVWLYFFGMDDSFDFFRNIRQVPTTYLVSGLALFGIGGLHYLSERLAKIAKTYRIAGLKVTLISLFLLSFEAFSKVSGHSLKSLSISDFSADILVGFIVLSLLSLVLALVNTFLNPSKSQNVYLEGLTAIGLLAMASVVFFFPTTTALYAIIFNLALVGVIIVLLYEGYRREDMALVNLGIFWLEILVVARYFDFFWELLPRSAFFMVGGTILIFASVALERKRRELKKRFQADDNINNHG